MFKILLIINTDKNKLNNIKNYLLNKLYINYLYIYNINNLYNIYIINNKNIIKDIEEFLKENKIIGLITYNRIFKRK